MDYQSNVTYLISGLITAYIITKESSLKIRRKKIDKTFFFKHALPYLEFKIIGLDMKYTYFGR